MEQNSGGTGKSIPSATIQLQSGAKDSSRWCFCSWIYSYSTRTISNTCFSLQFLCWKGQNRIWNTCCLAKMNIGFASYKFSQGCICKIFPIKCDWTDRKVATVREWPWRGSVLKATLRLSCCQWMTHASLPENPTNVYKLLLAWNWDPVAAVNTISLQRLEMQSLYLFLARGGRVSENMKRALTVTALIDFLYCNGWIPPLCHHWISSHWEPRPCVLCSKQGYSVKNIC